MTVRGTLQPGTDGLLQTEVTQRLSQAVTRVQAGSGIQANSEIIQHVSITDAILEHANNYDAIVVGATGRGLLPKLLFGQIPENIAKRSDRAVILVKTYHPVKALLGRVMRE